MKKNRLAAVTFAFAVSMLVCGCDQVYELTDEEEAVVVNYSAHAVTKFNKRQSEGIRDITALEAQMAAKEEQKNEEQQEEPQESATEDTQTAPAQEPAVDTDSSQQNQTNYVSLNQALQLGGIDAVYKKYEVSSSYKETESYVVSANSGNELLILYVNLKNNGNKTAKCDILSKMPSFRLKINQELSISADTTILLNDLGTYQGKIPAGGTQKTVLIFQVGAGTVKTVKSLDLEVTIDDTSSQVQLVAD